MKLLVHACCGPCSIMPTRILSDEGHDIAVFYANSNIAPAAEYGKRLEELKRYAGAQGIDVVEGCYDPAAWERDVAPIGEAIKQFSPALGRAFASRHAGGDGADESGDAGKGDEANAGAGGEANAGANVASVSELLDDERRRERCRACYRLRLEEAAAYAAQNGYEGLSTTLAVSPYQFTDVIHEELQRAASQAGVAAHFEDFRPYYDEATRISRELGMYRQNYCGCRFSIAEGEATRAFVKQQRKAAKAAKAAARAAEDEASRKRKEARAAYAEAQAKKRAILKTLRNKA